MFYLIFALLVILSVVKVNAKHDHLQSPVVPRVPQCDSYNKTLVKQTKKKVLSCTMFKDEEGFLAEFVAYYKVHGLDHIILWNHESSDNFYKELAPWTSTGFVELRNTSEFNNLPHIVASKSFHSKYAKVMLVQRQVENECIAYGIAHKYDYYLSLDVDEFIVPERYHYKFRSEVFVPVADVIEGIFLPTESRIAEEHAAFVANPDPDADPLNYSGGANASDPVHMEREPSIREILIPLLKHNYASTPHVLEPIDQLTFEAYTSRYPTPGRMNFYLQNQPKMLYRLSGLDFRNRSRAQTLFDENPHIPLTQTHLNMTQLRSFTDAQVWMSSCCFIHGCERREKSKYCLRPWSWLGDNKLKKKAAKPSPFWLRTNHYSRSYEKFQLKQATWGTMTSASSFMSRSFGWEYDPVALMYSCTVRHEINRAKLEYIARKKQPMYSTPNPLLWHFDIATPPSMHHFQRQGDNWYRNPEFGLTIAHPNKRWDRVTGAGGDESGLTINHTKASYNPTLVESLYAASTDTQLLFQDHYT